MADPTPRKQNVGPPNNKPLTRSKGRQAYFFLDGRLYKIIRQDRPRDILTAKDIEKDKLVKFLLSDAKKRMKPAYDTKEVAYFLNRNRVTIQGYVINGKINSPVRVPKHGVNASGKTFDTLKWSEADIIALHEHMLYIGGGRPRKDGTLYAATRLPSRKELLAVLRQQPMFYMKTADGEMTPVWSAYNEV